jgi:hypothetical protein
MHTHKHQWVVVRPARPLGRKEGMRDECPDGEGGAGSSPGEVLCAFSIAWKNPEKSFHSVEKSPKSFP